MSSKSSYYKSKKDSKQQSIRLNLRFLNYGLGLLVLAFVFIYLFGISDLTAKGFILQDLRHQLDEVSEDRVAYEDQVNKLQSYHALNEKLQPLGMVAVTDIEYIKVNAPIVAKK